MDIFYKQEIKKRIKKLEKKKGECIYIYRQCKVGIDNVRIKLLISNENEKQYYESEMKLLIKKMKYSVRRYKELRVEIKRLKRAISK